MMDRRNHPRANISVQLRIDAPGFTTRGIASDISTRGCFVQLAEEVMRHNLHDVRLHFAIDTGFQVISRQISGKVVRNEGNGLAICFVEYDIIGQAVTHELMYYLQLSRGESLPAGGCTHDRTHCTPQDHAA